MLNSIDRFDAQIAAAKRELLALKRGMYGGARAYFNTQATTRKFTGVTSGTRKIILSFEQQDFPFLYITAIPTGSNTPLAYYVTQRSGRYEWTVFLSPGTTYTLDCICVAEQVATWNLT